MSQLPQYLQSAVKDNAISLAQAEPACSRRWTSCCRTRRPSWIRKSGRQHSCFHLYLMDSSKMTQH